MSPAIFPNPVNPSARALAKTMVDAESQEQASESPASENAGEATKRSDAAAKNWRRLVSVLRIPARLLLGLALLSILLSVLLVGGLRWVNPPVSAFMLRHAHNVWKLDQTPPYYRYDWIPWERIPPTVRLAAIAGEDQRFPRHFGFDPIEIRQAWNDYRQGGRLRGASTITQQAAKNLFLWPGSSWWRKGLEAWFTLLMEMLWPKERILEIYLNIAQFSPSTYGIEATSTRYFGHPASELSLAEAALLIGALPGPGHYQLDQPSASLQRRADWILDQSQRLGGMRYLKQL